MNWTSSPQGMGLPPQKVLIMGIFLHPNEDVRWQFDHQGWAIGYQIVDKARCNDHGIQQVLIEAGRVRMV